MIVNIFYAFPKAAYLLLFALFALAAFYLLHQYRKKKIEDFASKAWEKGLLLPRSQRVYFGKSLAFVTAWIFAVIAFMQPIGFGSYFNPDRGAKSVSRPMQNIILLLDASASMLVKDSADGNTRLQYSKEIAEELIDRLKGENIALYGMTSEAIPFSPLTADYLYVRLALQRLNVNPEDTAGTDLIHTFHQIGQNALADTVILISDGEDTAIESLQGKEKDLKIQQLLNNTNRFRIYAIGVGTTQPKAIPGVIFEGRPVESFLREELLKKISQAGGGAYYYANNYTPSRLASEIVSSLKRSRERDVVPGMDILTDFSVNHYYQIPLGIAVMLLIGMLLWPDAHAKRRISPQSDKGAKK